MARLSAFFTCSLDLRVADASGDFRWAEPPEDAHAFANGVVRGVGTHLYGRRMWQTMRFWESMPEEDSVMGEFGSLWRDADKVVWSRTLDAVDTARTRLEPRFDPAALRRMKSDADRDLTIGGADLAGQAMRAGLVDDLLLLLVPVVIGEGPRALPDGFAAGLELAEHRLLSSGWVHLRYAVRS